MQTFFSPTQRQKEKKRSSNARLNWEAVSRWDTGSYKHLSIEDLLHRVKDKFSVHTVTYKIQGSWIFIKYTYVYNYTRITIAYV